MDYGWRNEKFGIPGPRCPEHEKGWRKILDEGMSLSPGLWIMYVKGARKPSNEDYLGKIKTEMEKQRLAEPTCPCENGEQK